MKKNLLFLAAFTLMFSFANAQFTVLLVNDNTNSSETAAIDSAIEMSGYTYGAMRANDSLLTFDTLNSYDMVLWSTSNKAFSLDLWDVSDTTSNGPMAVKFNAPLMQYLDSNKVVWIDGIDFLYDLYPTVPTDFVSGDFIYDVMGISSYVGQTHRDDTLGGCCSGLPVAYKSATNTFSSQDSIYWKWGSLWNGDALDITPAATSLFKMGPASYYFAAKDIALYKENLVTSSIRIGALGNGSFSQDDVNTIVKEMIIAAEAGTFVKSTVGIESNKQEVIVKAFPNPASNMINFTFPKSNKVSIAVFDVAGKEIMNKMIDGSNGSYRMNISELNTGIYFYQIAFDNTIATYKFSVVK
ncbi:MAG: T9SS type A sorting domain-containing protein [Bacteroidales bacterium]|nr:T9SS type A sorting domain-containing protein [Bacteroidales bacterium]